MTRPRPLPLLGVLGLLAAAQGRLVRDYLDVEASERRLDGFLQNSRATTAHKLPCEAPVAKAPVKFPTSLAGRAVYKGAMWSGYMPVTPRDYLFYWFMEAENEPETKPLILWTNGGPGCSSMEAATTETGPLSLFEIKQSGPLHTGQFSTNPYAWTKFANVLYVDQPRYVGFSTGSGLRVLSSVDAARDIVKFLEAWYRSFPLYAPRSLILAAESYGGHYVPAFSAAIRAHNMAAPSARINLKGLLIGNGCVNDAIQDDTTNYIDLLHAQNLIPADVRPSSKGEAQRLMQDTLGYSPNYYDYRVKNLNCKGCYSYDYNDWSHWFLQDEVLKALNVCGNAGDSAFAGDAGGCIALPRFDANDKFDYSGAIAEALEAGIEVLFYYGMTDLACPYLPAYRMAQALPWKGREAWASMALSPLTVSGARVGSQKSLGGLTWVEIEASGHMTPADSPAATAAAVRMLLSQIESNAAPLAN